MTVRDYKQAYHKLVFLVLAGLLPLVAGGHAKEVLAEKRIGVAMRTIGHEVLLHLGDRESRILPIEKQAGQYRIPFEREFGIDPEDLVSIIDRVMSETGIATGYLVEVERWDPQEVVHSYEMRNAEHPVTIPCRGRVLPADCYSLLITILDGNVPVAEGSLPDGLYPASLEIGNAGLGGLAFLIVPFFILLVLVGYLVRKKDPADADPDLISIGAFRFDKRNMVLSFENNKVELSHKEAELLSLLSASANAPIEREVILQRVWGDEGHYVGRTLDVFISKLRKKLEADVSVRIVNIRGVGYKLVMEDPG